MNAVDSDVSYALYASLSDAIRRPPVFSVSSVSRLWTDKHISSQMLACHLDPDSDAASRSHAFIDASVDWIGKRLGLKPQMKLADFGCGPGLYCERLARRGLHVTGIDFSPSSLAHARQQAATAGLSIDYIEADYLQFQTQSRFDVILLIYCDLCALPPAQRLDLLRRMRGLLTADGRVLFDVHADVALNQRREGCTAVMKDGGGFWSSSAHHEIHSRFLYHQDRVSLDLYTIIQEDRVWQVHNWLQYYDRTSITTELREAGFAVEAIFDDVTGKPFTGTAADMAILARAL